MCGLGNRCCNNGCHLISDITAEGKGVYKSKYVRISKTCLTASCIISYKNMLYSPVLHMVPNKEFGNNLNKVKQLWSQPWDGLEGFISHLSCVTTATQADRFLKSGHTNPI